MVSAGDLTKARKEIEAKDREIAMLQGKLNAAEQELAKMKADYEKQLADAKDAYQREIEAAIARAEAAEKKSAAQRETINRLDRKVNPHRYQLSSGAELSNMQFFSPNSYTYTFKIWTKVGEIEHNAVAYLSDNDTRLTAYRNGELTAHELVNELFPSDNRSTPSNRTYSNQPSSCSVADPRKPMAAQAVAAQPPPTAVGTAKPATTSAPNAANNHISFGM